ncbi:MAG: glycosyltransferase family 9 protein [Lentimicrobiaceae bacterium]|nr:glycosyltransferase family 9 protein [Lentimicrobiaceae bacterium]
MINAKELHRILIIQTASLGDVILSTALAETLHAAFPDAKTDFLIKKGYESLFQGHPFINQVFTWDKTNHKYQRLWHIAMQMRKNRYSAVINVHRFASSGFITAFAGAPYSAGFHKNPLSAFFKYSVEHVITAQGDGKHETDRNHALIQPLTDLKTSKPGLYPTAADKQAVETYQQKPYITVSPASLWFTKQYPAEKWVDFLNLIPDDLQVFLLGSKADIALCKEISSQTHHKNLNILAGSLTFLQSAALMKGALMNYVNDSAPQHLASAVNAPVTVIFCSTVPEFGFGPLSDNAHIVQTTLSLPCRPCGLHGFKACPLGHFDCAHSIQTIQLLDTLPPWENQ